MSQGDDQQPGECRCPQCDGRWYSAAMLREVDGTCPECGAALDPTVESDDAA